MLPTSAFPAKTRAVTKRRIREFKRFLFSQLHRKSVCVPLLTFIICISLLRFGDDSSSNSLRYGHVERYAPQFYWDIHTVHDAHLPADSYPSPKDLHKFISAAAKYIIRASHIAAGSPKTHGRFVYRWTLTKHGGISISKEYNTLRHSGTAYALGDACPPAKPKLPAYCHGSKTTLARAAEWLLQSAAPIGEEGVIGLWSRPEDENSGKPYAEVRSGGIGLGLISLVNGHLGGSKNVTKVLLRDVARAATDVFQQKDGVMMSYFTDERGRIDGRRVSPYYAGEAALGLLKLYEMNRNTTLRTSAVRALINMAYTGDEVEESGDKTVCDHWYLIATGNLFRDNDYDRQSVDVPDGRREREILLRHARRVARACHRRNKKRIFGNKVNANSYGSTSEATLNVLPVLLESGLDQGIGETEAGEMFCVVKRIIGAAMAMQYRNSKAGEKFGKLLDGAVSSKGELAEVDDSHRERANFDGTFRIDTTQHTLSGVLAYIRVASHPSFTNIECHNEAPLVLFQS